jgi:hypothetical protein
MNTRKTLIAYDPAKPDDGRSDFLVPLTDGDSPQFIGLRSGKPVDMGVLTFVGREVSVNDMFAKLVDSRRKIPDVKRTLKSIQGYIDMLQEFKIGNVLKLEPTTENELGFKLVLVARMPATEKLPLP